MLVACYIIVCATIFDLGLLLLYLGCMMNYLEKLISPPTFLIPPPNLQICNVSPKIRLDNEKEAIEAIQ